MDDDYAYDYRLNKDKIHPKQNDGNGTRKEAQPVYENRDMPRPTYRDAEAYRRNFGDPEENRERYNRRPKPRRETTGKVETIRTGQEEYMRPGSSSDAYDTQKITVPPSARRRRTTQNGRTKSKSRSGNSKTPKRVVVDDGYYVDVKTQNRRKSGSGKSRRHGSGKKHHGGRIFKRIIAVILVLFIIYSLLALFAIIRMNRVPTESRTRNSDAMYSTSVTNILLIGSDSRDPRNDPGRSDSIMLASINSHTHKLWFTSFLRDAYVTIPGYGQGKLNSAYAHGGAELLMDTIETNYDLRIDNYVMVSFKGFADVIDSVGGVKITMSDEEAEALNIIMQSEVNEIMGDKPTDDLLSGGGTYRLDGKQALSYARIRYAGNADFERTQRQRTVMNQVFKKLRTGNPVYISRLLGNAMPEVTTNMDTLSLYLLSLRVPSFAFYHTEQQQIPADGTFSGADIDGESVLQVDFDRNIEVLKDTVLN